MYVWEDGQSEAFKLSEFSSLIRSNTEILDNEGNKVGMVTSGMKNTTPYYALF